MRGLLELGEPHAAFTAFRRHAPRLPTPPDVHVLRALLRVCVAMRSEVVLQRATDLLHAHSLPRRDVSDLLVRAYLAVVPMRRGARAAADDADADADAPASAALDAALDVYTAACEHRWDVGAGACRRMLVACARHDRMHDALGVLSHMHELGVEPGLAALDELMRAAQRGGEIDESTLRLWLGNDDGSAPTWGPTS
jgi:pentatricopeptide repeat protein